MLSSHQKVKLGACIQKPNLLFFFSNDLWFYSYHSGKGNGGWVFAFWLQRQGVKQASWDLWIEKCCYLGEWHDPVEGPRQPAWQGGGCQDEGGDKGTFQNQNQKRKI